MAGRAPRGKKVKQVQKHRQNQEARKKKQEEEALQEKAREEEDEEEEKGSPVQLTYRPELRRSEEGEQKRDRHAEFFFRFYRSLTYTFVFARFALRPRHQPQLRFPIAERTDDEDLFLTKKVHSNPPLSSVALFRNAFSSSESLSMPIREHSFFYAFSFREGEPYENIISNSSPYLQISQT